MAKRKIKDYTLYRWRFWIGYGLIAILTTLVLAAALLFAPSGISPVEQGAVLKSAGLSLEHPDSLLVIDAPFYLLQRLTIALFGVTGWSIALPSMLAGLIIISCLLYLLQLRFRHSIGIITVGIVAMSPFFINIATAGTPNIMLALWPILLLALGAAALHTSSRRTRSSIMLVALLAAGCSLFTPFSFLLCILLGAVALAHPRSRFALRKTSRGVYVIGAAWIALAGAATGYLVYKTPSAAQELLYKTDSFSLDMLHNLRTIGSQFIIVTGDAVDSLSTLTPLFSIGTIALAGIGVYHLAKWRHALLSYLVAMWVVTVAILIILNPYATVLMFAPFCLLVAVGTDSVLRYWYRLFPFNPYARVFGLIPVTILFSGLLFSGVSSYFYSYHYNASLANQTTDDVALALRELDKNPGAQLATTQTDAAFYRFALDSHDKTDVIVTTHKPNAQTAVVATRDAQQLLPGVTQYVVAANHGGEHSDRLYVYQTNDK